MRVHKYRALRNGKFEYFTLGELVWGKSYQNDDEFDKWCEYINLNDKHNKEIYESDLIVNDLYKQPRLVIWHDRYGSWALKDSTGVVTAFYDKERKDNSYEVVGNIHETPELFKDVPCV